VQPLLAAEAPSNHSLREFVEIGIPVVETRRKSGGRVRFASKNCGSLAERNSDQFTPIARWLLT
jgi:hypothetical protein